MHISGFLKMASPAAMVLAIGLGGSPAVAAEAAPPQESAEAIVVWGRAQAQIGIATAGSQGVVGYADLEKRPILRVGELVETVPGVIATQHSGTGKANQYFLRGFNLDHGTDFAGFVDGMPVNMRTHGHGQGYLDYNFLIPELVERVDYAKGPYSVDAGDFSAAGTVRFSTYRQLARPFVEVTAGSNDYYRGLAALSMDDDAGGTTLVGIEGLASRGPWVLDENHRKANLLAKYSRDDWSVTAMAYHARWNSTDQIPLRAVEDGSIPRLGYIDPDLGGRTTRLSLSGDAEIGDGTSVNAYAIYYQMRLTSNFTYFAADPVNGDEFQQRDKRGIFGGAIRHHWDGATAGIPTIFRLGADTRYDLIGRVGLYPSVDGRRRDPIRQDKVDEYSVSGYGEAELALGGGVRAILGLRGDFYGYDVDADISANSGLGTDAQLSPKVALAWAAAKGLEFYANYGESFHSNDARGAAISIDPATGDPVDSVDLLVRARGAEIGARVEGARFNASLVGFWLKLGSELVFVGDAGTTEPNDASKRLGMEFNAFWRPVDAVSFDLSAAYTRARFSGTPSAVDRIPGSVGFVLGAGAAIDLGDGLSAALRVRHFGRAPLIEDGTVKSQPTTLVNLGGYKALGPWRIGVDIYNLFNARDADITYFYESRLANEAEPAEDIHFHPVEPRQFRVSLRRSF
ncbi:MAG: TonB-dependent receptor [Sphingomonas sp.]|nr:TonB-dependent receptor [Sphingomonas sp.]